MADNKDYVTHPDEKGSINISEDVIAIIASAAVNEVDGVASLSSGLGSDIAEKFGKRNPAKGIKLNVSDMSVTVEAYILVKYGFAVNEVAKAVQASVVNAVESMTGLLVPVVNVHVCGIAFDKEK